MCDKGRDVYRFVNRSFRLTKAKQGFKDNWTLETPAVAAKEVGRKFAEAAKAKPDSVALVVTGQYMNEEYQALFDFFVKDHGVRQVYHWINNPEDMDGFDGLLFRGDRNPNTTGLKKHLDASKTNNPWSELEQKLNSGVVSQLYVFGPENKDLFPDLASKVSLFAKAKNLVFFTAAKIDELDQVMTPTYQIPLKVYFEKSGSYTNHAGQVQKVQRGATFVPSALTVTEAVDLMAGRDLDMKARPGRELHVKDNYLSAERGRL
jgi:NADH-quinone oxidoreductase subunit G